MFSINAPVAQLGERRLPHSGKAKHGFARSERREGANRAAGLGERSDERSTLQRAALLQSVGTVCLTKYQTMRP